MTQHSSAGGYEAIILDCDGVIFDTNEPKSRAFSAVARAHGFPERTVSVFSSWQRENFGKSRYVAFRQLISGAFGDHNFQGTAEELAADFAALVEEIYAQASPTIGFRDLVQITEGVPLFVASGSEQAQLRSAFDRSGIAVNFRGIFGSPTAKVDIVRGIAEQIRANRVDARLLMVGDAHADADAAAAAGVDFVFMSGYSLVGESMRARSFREGFPSVVNLAELTDIIGATNGEAVRG